MISQPRSSEIALPSVLSRLSSPCLSNRHLLPISSLYHRVILPIVGTPCMSIDNASAISHRSGSIDRQLCVVLSLSVCVTPTHKTMNPTTNSNQFYYLITLKFLYYIVRWNYNIRNYELPRLGKASTASAVTSCLVASYKPPNWIFYPHNLIQSNYPWELLPHMMP